MCLIETFQSHYTCGFLRHLCCFHNIYDKLTYNVRFKGKGGNLLLKTSAFNNSSTAECAMYKGITRPVGWQEFSTQSLDFWKTKTQDRAFKDVNALSLASLVPDNWQDCGWGGGEDCDANCNATSFLVKTWKWCKAKLGIGRNSMAKPLGEWEP